MATHDFASNYALGSTNSEHERLIWQAGHIAPLTERLFREAGIESGHRVVDVGSGVGDVSMLLAKLVGPQGKVVGIERDAGSIARAASRATQAGLHNLEFLQADVSQIPAYQPFDALVGRFILMWLPDPVAALGSLSQLVRSGGIIAFQETYWAPMIGFIAKLPLWSAASYAIHETFRGSGANPDLGPGLYKAFQDAGLPSPTMRAEMLMGRQPHFARWIAELVRTLRAEDQQFGARLGELGDLATLQQRLQAELESSETVAAWPACIGAWCRKQS